MARVHLFEKRERFQSRGLVVSLLIFAALAALFLGMLSQVETKSVVQQNRLLEDALRRAAISCYSIEGRYPPSIDYMMEHYGVVYDEEKYIISYSAFGSNIMPTFTVLTRGVVYE